MTSIETNNTAVNVLRIIKIATCPTNSGKATLAYQIGCNAEHEIFLRVTANTGGGLFSPEWVSIQTMLATLETARKPIASFPLLDLLIGKSINTPAFLMAAMKNEDIVRSLEGKIRGYEIVEQSPFMLDMKALIDSDVNLSVKDIPSEYKTSIALTNKKVAKELTPKEEKRKQREINTLLKKQ